MLNKLPVVLLIDDDMVSREVTATLLTMSGYSVHTAESGEGALRMFARSGGKNATVHPEVILMDAQMPGLSGVQLIAKLRACSKARIYAISGSNPPPEVAAAADGFLCKPFDVGALRTLLERQETQTVQSYLDPDEPLIRGEVLGQLRNLMPEAAVRQIYATVVTDLEQRIGTLEGAIARGATDEIRRIGHAIKGGCGMAGAVQAARLGALLEATPPDSSDNHLNNSTCLLHDLRTAVSGLKRMLDSGLPD